MVPSLRKYPVKASKPSRGCATGSSCATTTFMAGPSLQVTGGDSLASECTSASTRARIGRSEFLRADDRAKAALGAAMAELRAGNIEGGSAVTVGDRANLVRGNVQELGRWVHKALDEPRTGDAIDLRPLAGYPLHHLTSVMRTILFVELCVKRQAVRSGAPADTD